MSNALKALTKSLRCDALSARHVRRFVEAKQRHEALGRYTAASDVLRALANERMDGYAERERLTRVLLHEHQRYPNALWSSLLIVAYYPMLSRLRFRLVNKRIPGDDLDQLVLIAFLGTIEQLPFERKPDRIAMHLRQFTAKQLFRLVSWEARVDVLIDEKEAELFEVSESELVTRDDLHGSQMMLRDMRSCLRKDLDESAIGTIAATVIGQEELQSYVARAFDEAPEEQERVYERLKRQRTRAFGYLRQFVGRKDVLFEQGV